MNGARAPGRWAGLLLAVGAGVAVELVVCGATGEREAWDAKAYWTMGYPALALTCLVLGALFPSGAWLLGFAAVIAQVGTMMLRTEGGSLWPIGLTFAAVLGVPCALAAWVGARLRGLLRADNP